jgi:hypothetical protein
MGNVTLTDHPQTNGANIQWTGGHCAAINKGVTEPTIPSISTYVSVAFTSGPTKYSSQLWNTFNAVSVSQVVLWIYGKTNHPEDATLPTVSIYMGGEWIDSDPIPLTDVGSWYPAIFNGNWTQEDVNSFQTSLNRVPGVGTTTIYALYRRVTYSVP